MSDKRSIKILVSCHKAVVYPKSDLFLPVHVGAAGKTPLVGMQPDDEGANISDRNFTYSELTAQYWAWKNLDADYVGLCHYRRYFCFDGLRHRSNDHAQIEDACLSARSIERYHIDDEQVIRSVVESNDLVCAPEWSVLGAPTPDGTKRTVRAHMVGYGLLTDADVDELVRLCRELRPAYAEDLARYLDGSRYLGYNCFIMRHELFDRLCDFEFPILQEFDRAFCYEGLTANRRRICGYLGEILFSAFVRHLELEEECSIARRPLVFFEKTPAPRALEASYGSVNIFWRWTGGSAERLSVGVSSLVSVLDPARCYRLTVICDQNLDEARLASLLGELPSNLLVVVAVLQALDLPSSLRELSDSELRLLLPLLLREAVHPVGDGARGRALWVEGCALFQGDPASIVDMNEIAPLSALRGVLLERELNKPANRSLREQSHSLACDQRPLDSAVLLIDLDAEEPLMDSGVLVEWLREAQQGNGDACPEVEKAALLARCGAQGLPLVLARPVLAEGDTRAWANAETLQGLSRSESSTLLSYAFEADPVANPVEPLSLRFWAAARECPAYELLLEERLGKTSASLKDLLFPPNSPRRRLLGRVKGLVRGIARRS